MSKALTFPRVCVAIALLAILSSWTASCSLSSSQDVATLRAMMDSVNASVDEMNERLDADESVPESVKETAADINDKFDKINEVANNVLTTIEENQGKLGEFGPGTLEVGAEVAGLIPGYGSVASLLLISIAGIWRSMQKSKLAKKNEDAAISMINAIERAKSVDHAAGGPGTVNFKDPVTKMILKGMNDDAKALVNKATP